MRFVSSLLIHINTSTHGGAVDGYYLPYPTKSGSSYYGQMKMLDLWPIWYTGPNFKNLKNP